MNRMSFRTLCIVVFVTVAMVVAGVASLRTSAEEPVAQPHTMLVPF
jgi:hypothetical protein